VQRQRYQKPVFENACLTSPTSARSRIRLRPFSNASALSKFQRSFNFIFLTFWVSVLECCTLSCNQTINHKPSTADSQCRVIAWLNEWPYAYEFSIEWYPKDRPTPPSYDDWFQQGRRIPGLSNELFQLLKHLDSRVELPLVARTLGQIGNVTSCPVLSDSLKSNDARLRREAANAIGLLRCGESIQLLCSMLLHDTDRNVRVNVALALGRIGDRRAVPALRAAMKDEASFVAVVAKEALQKLGQN
jgi:hypothetical protein